MISVPRLPILLFLSALVIAGCSKEDPVSPPEAPVIQAFSASPASIAQGDSSVLTWQVTNSPDAATIDNGVGNVKSLSSVVVRPTQTTTYRLIVSNSGGSDTASVQVSVSTEPRTGPTSVAANSRSESSIGVAWHRQPYDQGADTVIAFANGLEAKRMVAASPDSTAVLQGLLLNQVYSLSVHSRYGVSTSTVNWSPAIRTESIRLYETNDNSTEHYSGIVLNGTDIGMAPNAQAVSVALSAQWRDYTDLVFASDATSPSQLTLVSPAVTSLSSIEAGRYSKFSEAILAQGGMDNIYYSGDLRQSIQTSDPGIINAVEIPVAASLPLVFNLLTADNHFARVEVVRQSDGLLYGGTTNHHYVDLTISYQPVLNYPYARRAINLRGPALAKRWRAR